LLLPVVLEDFEDLGKRSPIADANHFTWILRVLCWLVRRNEVIDEISCQLCWSLRGQDMTISHNRWHDAPNCLITQHLNAWYPPKSSYLNQNRHLIWIKLFTWTCSPAIPCIKWNAGAYPLYLRVNGFYQYFRFTFSTAWLLVRYNNNLQANYTILSKVLPTLK
jgi:hypothetical protein